MMSHRPCSKGFCMRGVIAALALTMCFSTAALGANYVITGSVRNQSRSQPAAGDDVILVRLDRGTQQEEARTKTDASGTFILNVQHADKSYLIRVFHHGVSYDQQASAGGTISIQVFDAAPRVQGVTGSIEILRTGTNGKLLHVSDLIEIKNESSPPLTQASERTFEAYLPANAKIDSVLAAGPGNVSVMISAASVPGEPGHYTVNFPLRPGATKFAFNYDLPYDGHAAFQTRHAYPLRQLAVMIPPTMKFSSRPHAFEILATGNSRYQVQAANHLKAGEGPGFEISGTGTLPPLADQADSQAQSQSSAPPNPTPSVPARTGLHPVASIDSRFVQTEPRSQMLVLGGLTAFLLAASVLLVWRARKARKFSGAQTIAPRSRQGNRPQPDWKLL
jgi:hypothetical protein